MPKPSTRLAISALGRFAFTLVAAFLIALPVSPAIALSSCRNP